MFTKLYQDEKGITALETAIILIAFIVGASVFAFTILSAGSFSTERGTTAVYSGLKNVQASMEVKGDIIATATTTGTTSAEIDTLIFTVTNIIGGHPIDLDSNSGVLTVNYLDEYQSQKDLTWSVNWLNRYDGDSMLDKSELAEITVQLSGTISPSLSINQTFALELIPSDGAAISINGATPPYINSVNVID